MLSDISLKAFTKARMWKAMTVLRRDILDVSIRAEECLTFIHSLKSVDFQTRCGINALLQGAEGLCSVISYGRKDERAAER